MRKKVWEAISAVIDEDALEFLADMCRRRCEKCTECD